MFWKNMGPPISGFMCVGLFYCIQVAAKIWWKNREEGTRSQPITMLERKMTLLGHNMKYHNENNHCCKNLLKPYT
jgi:hypothetical protein